MISGVIRPLACPDALHITRPRREKCIQCNYTKGRCDAYVCLSRSTLNVILPFRHSRIPAALGIPITAALGGFAPWRDLQAYLTPT